jgi:hypothetical protein
VEVDRTRDHDADDHHGAADDDDEEAPPTVHAVPSDVAGSA